MLALCPTLFLPDFELSCFLPTILVNQKIIANIIVTDYMGLSVSFEGKIKGKAQCQRFKHTKENFSCA